MRLKNVIVGLSVAIFAFGGLFILLDQKAPKIVRWYCQGQTHNRPNLKWIPVSNHIKPSPLFNSQPIKQPEGVSVKPFFLSILFF